MFALQGAPKGEVKLDCRHPSLIQEQKDKVRTKASLPRPPTHACAGACSSLFLPAAHRQQERFFGRQKMPFYSDDDVASIMYPAGPDKQTSKAKIRELRKRLREEKEARFEAMRPSVALVHSVPSHFLALSPTSHVLLAPPRPAASSSAPHLMLASSMSAGKTRVMPPPRCAALPAPSPRRAALPWPYHAFHRFVLLRFVDVCAWSLLCRVGTLGGTVCGRGKICLLVGS